MIQYVKSSHLRRVDMHDAIPDFILPERVRSAKTLFFSSETQSTP